MREFLGKSKAGKFPRLVFCRLLSKGEQSAKRRCKRSKISDKKHGAFTGWYGDEIFVGFHIGDAAILREIEGKSLLGVVEKGGESVAVAVGALESIHAVGEVLELVKIGHVAISGGAVECLSERLE